MPKSQNRFDPPPTTAQWEIGRQFKNTEQYAKVTAYSLSIGSKLSEKNRSRVAERGGTLKKLPFFN